MFLETAPGRGNVQHGFASDPPQGGASKKHRTPERCRLPVRCPWIERFLIKAQKIENKEHRQKRRLGRKKLFHAKPVRVELGFELLNALLAACRAWETGFRGMPWMRIRRGSAFVGTERCLMDFVCALPPKTADKTVSIAPRGLSQSLLKRPTVCFLCGKAASDCTSM